MVIVGREATSFDHKTIVMVTEIVVSIRSDSNRVGQGSKKVVGLRSIEFPTDESKYDAIGERVFFYRQELVRSDFAVFQHWRSIHQGDILPRLFNHESEL